MGTSDRSCRRPPLRPASGSRANCPSHRDRAPDADRAAGARHTPINPHAIPARSAKRSSEIRRSISWRAECPSRRVDIVESRSGQHHPLALKGDRLSFEQAPLAGSLCQRPIGADHAMPRCSVRVSATQHITRQSRGTGRDVAIGTHIARGNRSHPSQDRCLGISGRPSCHVLDGGIAVEAVPRRDLSSREPA